jgi:hypothetical protein
VFRDRLVGPEAVAAFNALLLGVFKAQLGFAGWYCDLRGPETMTTDPIMTVTDHCLFDITRVFEEGANRVWSRRGSNLSVMVSICSIAVRAAS